VTIDLDAIKAKLAEYDDSVPRCPKKVARTVNYAPDYLTPQHTACTDAVYREYDLTTYSPCCRPEGHEGECRNSRLILGWPGHATLKALVAEVADLRNENHKLRDVLEWINVQCPSKCSGVCDAALRGEYRSEEEP
jgi:hypothetical protein